MLVICLGNTQRQSAGGCLRSVYARQHPELTASGVWELIVKRNGVVPRIWGKCVVFKRKQVGMLSQQRSVSQTSIYREE